MIKSPIEFVVGAYRRSGPERTRWTTTGYSGAMGQAPFCPPNVAGWKGGRTWINTRPT